METTTWTHATVTLGVHGLTPATAGAMSAALESAIEDGDIVGFHFLRKDGGMRLRAAGPKAADRLPSVLDGLADRGLIAGWIFGIYEPEVEAFGGPAGMDAAHDLFCADSRAVLAHLAAVQAEGPGAREAAVLLLSTLLRGAQLDWYEIGDVWARIAAERPPVDAVPAGAQLAQSCAAMLALMHADAAHVKVGTGWDTRVRAFADAGVRVRALADDGTLGRGQTPEVGLRAVLAHHAIFALNRAGLTSAQQAELALLAKTVVFSPPSDVSPPGAAAPAGSVVQMESTITPTAADQASELRATLVQNLKDADVLSDPRIADAFLAVERHKFLPGVDLATAYADDAVTVKTADTGIVISAISQPTIVATMLRQLDPQPGDRVLEAGAATGYNAALIGNLVGPDGYVWTIDVDQDLIDGANAHLAAAGVGNVTAVLGDGGVGLPEHGPYDRIIFTVGAGDVPAVILDQLAPGGRLVIPVRIRGGVSRAIALQHNGDQWVSVSSEMATFMPLRKGIADDERVITALSDDGGVTLHTYAEQNVDTAAITKALDYPGYEVFSGVKFRKGTTWEWLNLWLTCALPSGISRMPASGPEVESGKIRPQFPWGSMAAVEADTIAYLSMREGQDESGRFWEAAVIGHGPNAAALAEATGEQIRAWSEGHRDTVPTFRVATGPSRETLHGRFTVAKPGSRIALDWA
ncbi:protein-L-isoaspartate(D-aspartate)O-methyltransferase [Catenulispora acidiphila DSM 44928]|uniref:Protein-L-isoaspartate O-methyltransferase n=1 Tax=Catenulispora acidiphila (strain DSM 44928 / JCM 14897 / NBRC 102108 / NRRL B-24433 / ID139908) TaxID=479433 RepID=C7QEQ1_CATAD|nr:methyltransferase, FxLD system [Catenulispora acidiphila]ACU72821.1 protein-L-isoaspartate(D-aspartate)O-methyltransferase [Catenulispora acidiphila DSM 44928]